MSIQNTIDQLQMLHRTIPGVVSTPSKYPGSINSAELPLVIVWPSAAQTLPVTARNQVIRMNREYQTRVFVEAMGQGDYDTPARDGITLLGLFLDVYFANPTLSDGYTQIVDVRDSGLISGASTLFVAPLVYAGVFYKGFTLALNIVELMSIIPGG